MQIFGYPVAINIKAYEENGGTLKWHDSHDIVSPVYNKWVHLNVVHMFTERQIYVYVDGKLIRSFRVKEDAPSYYFKCGVYSTVSEVSEVTATSLFGNGPIALSRRWFPSSHRMLQLSFS